jgi:hypothetical protein
MCWWFSRAVQKHGSKILSTYSCKHGLHERTVSLSDAVIEEITNVSKEVGFQDVSDNDVVGISAFAINE